MVRLTCIMWVRALYFHPLSNFAISIRRTSQNRLSFINVQKHIQSAELLWKKSSVLILLLLLLLLVVWKCTLISKGGFTQIMCGWLIHSGTLFIQFICCWKCEILSWYNFFPVKLLPLRRIVCWMKTSRAVFVVNFNCIQVRCLLQLWEILFHCKWMCFFFGFYYYMERVFLHGNILWFMVI